MPKNRDGWLANLLADMYDRHFSVGLTLTVGGLLISGQPISPEEFIRISGESIVEATQRVSSESAEVLKAYFEDEAERAKQVLIHDAKTIVELLSEPNSDEEALADEELQEKVNNLFPDYIQLKNVVIRGASVLPMRARIWRGRLSEVAGWNFGEFSDPPVRANSQ